MTATQIVDVNEERTGEPALPIHLRSLHPISEIVSVRGSFLMHPPVRGVLLTSADMNDGPIEIVAGSKGKFSDAVKGVMYFPSENSQCEVHMIRFNDRLIHQSGLSYSFFFEILAGEQSASELLLQSAYGAGQVAQIDVTSEYLGEVHSIREFQWEVTRPHDVLLGFGEIDMVGPVTRFVYCYWLMDNERSDEQAIRYAVRDSVHVRELASEPES